MQLDPNQRFGLLTVHARVLVFQFGRNGNPTVCFVFYDAQCDGFGFGFKTKLDAFAGFHAPIVAAER